jgi:LETM1 and EF-hand domain-containing protein 1
VLRQGKELMMPKSFTQLKVQNLTLYRHYSMLYKSAGLKRPVASPLNSWSRNSPNLVCSSTRAFCSSPPENKDKEEPKELTVQELIKKRRETERKERKKEPKRAQRIKMKLSATMRDYKEVFVNLRDMDISLLAWKTKEFMARNYKRFKNLMKHAWIEIKKIGKGFRTLKEDLSYSIRTTTDTTFKEYGSYTFESRVRIRQTWSDLFKFIPFSIFIIIPGLELLLPAWLVIFPNAIPSQFQSDSAKQKKLDELVKKQQASSEKLMKIFPQRISDLLKDRDVLPEDKEKLLKLKSLLKDPEVLTTDLLEYRELFAKYLTFRHVPPKTILLACNLLSLQPVTGLNSINNLLKFFKTEIPVDSPSISWFTKLILHREFTLYMRKLRQDDSMIRFQEIENMDDPTLNRVCFERGIPISIFTRNQKLRELKKWHTLSNLKNVPDTLLLYCRLIKFSNTKSTHDHFTDEYQILRRCPNEVYFYEKQRMLEETLAIDELKTLVEMINRRRQLKEEEPGFSAEELDNYAVLLKKLRQRYDDLNREIETTYKLGNKMVEYVENTIIVDYHLECKQKELESEAPQLAEKAKEIFGNEFYYNFPNDKEELKEGSKWVTKLKERKEELERQLSDTVESNRNEKMFASM